MGVGVVPRPRPTPGVHRLTRTDSPVHDCRGNPEGPLSVGRQGSLVGTPVGPSRGKVTLQVWLLPA